MRVRSSATIVYVEVLEPILRKVALSSGSPLDVANKEGEDPSAGCAMNPDRGSHE